MNVLDFVLNLLPEQLKVPLNIISDSERQNISEIHIRENRPLSVTLFGQDYIISRQGILKISCDDGFVCGTSDINEVFKKICGGSVHSFEREISDGFITLDGGIRAGFCGTYTPPHNSLCGVKNITSINIRIPKEIIGSADEIYNRVGENFHGLIIAGSPASGKTTLLRDLCRILSQKNRVCIIDERSEIAPCGIGGFCDVYKGYPKEQAIVSAVRTMNPQYIACDEIGRKSDIKALEYAIGCGSGIIVTAHAPDLSSLRRKEWFAKLESRKAFDYACLLGRGTAVGKMVEFARLCQKY